MTYLVLSGIGLIIFYLQVSSGSSAEEAEDFLGKLMYFIVGAVIVGLIGITFYYS